MSFSKQAPKAKRFGPTHSSTLYGLTNVVKKLKVFENANKYHNCKIIKYETDNTSTVTKHVQEAIKADFENCVKNTSYNKAIAILTLLDRHLILKYRKCLLITCICLQQFTPSQYCAHRDAKNGCEQLKLLFSTDIESQNKLNHIDKDLKLHLRRIHEEYADCNVMFQRIRCRHHRLTLSKVIFDNYDKIEKNLDFIIGYACEHKPNIKEEYALYRKHFLDSIANDINDVCEENPILLEILMLGKTTMEPSQFNGKSKKELDSNYDKLISDKQVQEIKKGNFDAITFLKIIKDKENEMKEKEKEKENENEKKMKDDLRKDELNLVPPPAPKRARFQTAKDRRHNKNVVNDRRCTFNIDKLIFDKSVRDSGNSVRGDSVRDSYRVDGNNQGGSFCQSGYNHQSNVPGQSPMAQYPMYPQWAPAPQYQPYGNMAPLFQFPQMNPAMNPAMNGYYPNMAMNQLQALQMQYANMNMNMNMNNNMNNNNYNNNNNNQQAPAPQNQQIGNVVAQNGNVVPPIAAAPNLLAQNVIAQNAVNNNDANNNDANNNNHDNNESG